MLMIDDYTNLHYSLMKVNSVLNKAILRKAGELSLTKGQPKVLEALFCLEEADQTTIASFCEIDNATIGGIIDRMEAKGLIKRQMKAGNRRSVYVSLTDEGRRKAKIMNGYFRQIDDDAQALLSTDERESLKKILGKIMEALNARS